MSSNSSWFISYIYTTNDFLSQTLFSQNKIIFPNVKQNKIAQEVKPQNREKNRHRAKEFNTNTKLLTFEVKQTI